jgi:hypothetical protein
MELFIQMTMTCSLLAVILLGITLHKIRSVKQQLQRVEENVGNLAARVQTAFPKEERENVTIQGKPEPVTEKMQKTISSEPPICHAGKSQSALPSEPPTCREAAAEQEALLDAVLGEVFL